MTSLDRTLLEALIAERTVRDGTHDRWRGYKGGRLVKGRPQIHFAGQRFLVSHVVWYLKTGRWPDQLNHHDHLCREMNCIRFEHYYDGTQAENMADRAKIWGPTSGPGEANPRAFLTEADVHRIRRLCADGMSVQEVASLTKLNPNHVYKIRNGRVWSHI